MNLFEHRRDVSQEIISISRCSFSFSIVSPVSDIDLKNKKKISKDNHNAMQKPRA